MKIKSALFTLALSFPLFAQTSKAARPFFSIPIKCSIVQSNSETSSGASSSGRFCLKMSSMSMNVGLQEVIPWENQIECAENASSEALTNLKLKMKSLVDSEQCEASEPIVIGAVATASTATTEVDTESEAATPASPQKTEDCAYLNAKKFMKSFSNNPQAAKSIDELRSTVQKTCLSSRSAQQNASSSLQAIEMGIQKALIESQDE